MTNTEDTISKQNPSGRSAQCAQGSGPAHLWESTPRDSGVENVPSREPADTAHSELVCWPTALVKKTRLYQKWATFGTGAGDSHVRQLPKVLDPAPPYALRFVTGQEILLSLTQTSSQKPACKLLKGVGALSVRANRKLLSVQCSDGGVSGTCKRSSLPTRETWSVLPEAQKRGPSCSYVGRMRLESSGTAR